MSDPRKSHRYWLVPYERHDIVLLSALHSPLVTKPPEHARQVFALRKQLKEQVLTSWKYAVLRVRWDPLSGSDLGPMSNPIGDSFERIRFVLKEPAVVVLWFLNCSTVHAVSLQVRSRCECVVWPVFLKVRHVAPKRFRGWSSLVSGLDNDIFSNAVFEGTIGDI